MPKLWSDTIEAHRRSVREAILDTTARLVRQHGLRAVTMSRIAADTGIGRATLYKYFSDVEETLRAWHEREIDRHLEYLREVRDRGDRPRERIEAVLEAYALIRHQAHGGHDSDVAAFFHRDDRLAGAQRKVHRMLRDLLAEGATSGDVRDDVAPDELASYCIHALSAAGALTSKAAVARLVAVTLTGLQPRRG